MDVFDVDSEVLWLPDTFGYTGAIATDFKGMQGQLSGNTEDLLVI